MLTQARSHTRTHTPRAHTHPAHARTPTRARTRTHTRALARPPAPSAFVYFPASPRGGQPRAPRARPHAGAPAPRPSPRLPRAGFEGHLPPLHPSIPPSLHPPPSPVPAPPPEPALLPAAAVRGNPERAGSPGWTGRTDARTPRTEPGTGSRAPPGHAAGAPRRLQGIPPHARPGVRAKSARPEPRGPGISQTHTPRATPPPPASPRPSPGRGARAELTRAPSCTPARRHHQPSVSAAGGVRSAGELEGRGGRAPGDREF